MRWNFGCNDEVVISSCRCNDTAFLGTVLNCVNRYSTGQEDILWGYSFVEKFCAYNGNVTYNSRNLDSIYNSAVGDLLDPNGVQTGTLLRKAVDVNESTFRQEYMAAATAKNQYRLGSLFGWALLGYWAIVIFIASAFHFLRSRHRYLLEKWNNSWVASYRKNISLPAVFRGKHERPFKVFRIFAINAPTRGQSLIVLMYVILSVLVLCFDYQTYTPNPYLHSRQKQILRYMGNRTGVISFTQMPLVILFAGRNNPLRYITGWSYQTFQIYHHWTARVMVLHGVIHAVCFTWLAISTGTVGFRWQIRNWRFGNIALYVSLLMLVVASRAIRARLYEFFSISHRTLFLIFLVGIYYHCIDFGWMTWMYISTSMYLLDWMLRIFRTVNLGVITTATFTMCDEDSYRVCIRYPKEKRRASPGCYVYIRILKWNLFWQAHPFTVFQSPDKPDSLQLIAKVKDGSTQRIANYLMAQPCRSASLPVAIEGFYGNSARLGSYDNIFLMAGGIGVTAIYSQAMDVLREARSDQCVYFLWVIRNRTPLTWFEAELKQLLEHPNIMAIHVYVTQNKERPGRDGLTAEVCMNDLHGIGHELCRGLDIARSNEWDSVPEECLEDLDWMGQDLYNGVALTTPGKLACRAEKYADFFDTVRPSLYRVASASTTGIFSFSDEEEISGEDWCHRIEMHTGRPAVEDEVLRFIQASSGTIAICSCGPPAFVDGIRRAVANNINGSLSRIEYFEEAFSW
jgi:NAD(P)H-flavin reductase